MAVTFPLFQPAALVAGVVLGFGLGWSWPGLMNFAVVRLHPRRSLTLSDVRAFLTARGVAAFKAPEHLVVVDQLPHTPVGKPDKTRLRALVSAALRDA